MPGIQEVTVRWALAAAFVMSLAINLALWRRMRVERIERHGWKGYVADMPDDLTGVEQFDPAKYTRAGRRLFPWFVGSAAVTVVLFFAVAAMLER